MKASCTAGLAFCLGLVAAVAFLPGTLNPAYGAGSRSGGGTVPILPPLQELRAVVDRPLFSPTRRRPVQLAAVPLVSEPILLTGIVIAKGKRYAIIRNETGGPGRRITEGEMIGDRMVRRIQSDGIVLVTAGRAESVIRLFKRDATGQARGRTAR